MHAFFLVGATAVGKTEIGHRIAKALNMDVVSADSMLVYKGMDIGTGKPTAQQRSEVRYWCIDIVGPDEIFSAGLFRQAALRSLQQIAEQGREAIVVGGTGLYVKSLTHGLSQLPPSRPSCTEALELRLRSTGEHDAVLEELQCRAPDLYNSLPDKSNPRRIARAMELARQGIRTPRGSWSGIRQSSPLVGLLLSRADHLERIRKRVHEMYDSGLMEEVRQLHDQGISLSATARHAIGYIEALSAATGRYSKEQAMERTILRTANLSKRQATWFRHKAAVHWIDASDNTSADEIAASVAAAWKEHGPTQIVTG